VSGRTPRATFSREVFAFLRKEKSEYDGGATRSATVPARAKSSLRFVRRQKQCAINFHNCVVAKPYKMKYPEFTFPMTMILTTIY